MCEKCGERHYGRTHPFSAIRRKRDAASVPDLAAIRARADEVLQAMDMDPGPIGAEPYADWAQREALDVLSLVDLIEAARG